MALNKTYLNAYHRIARDGGGIVYIAPAGFNLPNGRAVSDRVVCELCNADLLTPNRDGLFEETPQSLRLLPLPAEEP